MCEPIQRGLNASTTPCSPASHKMSEVWLRKARRTQRANHFMRWFYLTNITLNVVLSYVGESPWVSRLAAIVLLLALVANEAMIHKLDETIKEVSDDTS